ncbi:MAG: hypothetical protein RMK60_06630 [Burkholderiales bacterium]|nr:hypothetical protein [Burkholderiales bacterium]
MFLPDSRYAGARRFAAGADGSLPFRGVRARLIGEATPMLEHTLQTGERLDALAQHYFNDNRRWWRILDANADVLCAAELELSGLPPLPRVSARARREPGWAPASAEPVLIPKARES